MKDDNKDIFKDNERNWEEDFKYENGNYMNRCIVCNRMFLGHKRRCVCKLCAFNKAEVENK